MGTTAAANTLTMSQIMNDWLSERRAGVCDASFSVYKMNIERYFMPMFGDMPLEALSVEFINEKTKQYIYSAEISAKRAHDILVELKAILRYIVDKYEFFIDWKKIVEKPYDNKQLSVLSEDEQKRLTLALQYSDIKHVGILLCLHTGIQVAELCALKWEDIHLTEKFIDVNKLFIRTSNDDKTDTRTKVTIGEPSNKSAIRKVPINSYVVDLLKRFSESRSPKHYLLSGTEKYYETRNMQRLLSICGEELKISSLDFRILRSTFASNCIKAGCNAEELAKLMGYSNGKLAYSAYEELFKQHNSGFSVELLPMIV